MTFICIGEPKKFVTHFNVILTLLHWSTTKLKISPICTYSTCTVDSRIN